MLAINHISPSMLGLFCRCQEAFRRRYVEGEIVPPGIAAITGTGMHRAAELNFVQKIDTGADLPLDTLQDAARDGYMAATENGVFIPRGEEASAKKELAKGLDRSVKLTAMFAEKVAPIIQPTASERRLEWQHEELPVPFLGILDVQTADGIHDLKSASRKWSAGKEDGQLQPPVYRWLIKEIEGQLLPFTFHVVTEKETQLVPAVTGEGEMEPVIARAKALINALKSGDFMPAEPGHWLCSSTWCGYYWTCPHIPAFKKNAAA